MTKKLYVLGSGFSRDVADIPTLVEISSEINRRQPELPQHISSFLNTLPSSLHANIEDLLSYLSMDLPWSNAIDRSLRHATFLALSKKFADLIIEYQEKKKDHSAAIVDLVEIWHATQGDVFTFNYDTLVERVVNDRLKGDVLTGSSSGSIQFNAPSESGNRYDYSIKRCLSSGGRSLIEYRDHGIRKEVHLQIPHGFIKDIDQKIFEKWIKSLEQDSNYGNIPFEFWEALKRLGNPFNEIIERSNFFDHYVLPISNLLTFQGSAVYGKPRFPYTKQSFCYFKLHGSVNWYYSGLQEVSDEKIYYDPLLDSKKAIAEQLGLTPLIIPPVLDKNSFYRNFSLSIQWQRALEVIQDSALEEVYFIGYSLPPTDFVVRQFFKKLGGIKIYLVDKSDDFRRKILLRNYINALTSQDPVVIEDIIGRKFSQKKCTLEGKEFDWSLSLDKEDASSTIENLVQHLRIGIGDNKGRVGLI